MIYNDATLYNARLFDRAYRILNDKVQAGGKTKNEFDMALVVPTAVNCAFSCELFLKAMLPKGTKGHKLFYELFKKLDSDIAEVVQDNVIRIMINKYNYKDYSKADFDSDLIKHERTFEDWRYFHEGKEIGVNLEFMTTLQACLKAAANGTLEKRERD